MLRALTACLHSQEAQAHALKAAQQAQEADKGTCPDTLPAACPAHQHLHAAAAAAAAGNQKPAVTNVRERHDTANQLDLPCPLPEEGSCPFAHAASDIPLAPGQLNICPFGHGSVGSGPFPGYVHGQWGSESVRPLSHGVLPCSMPCVRAIDALRVATPPIHA